MTDISDEDVERIAKRVTELNFNLKDAMPPGYVLDEAALIVPTSGIPVHAVVNGKKVRVGTGHIDPHTHIFTTVLDSGEENPAAGIWLGSLNTPPGAMSADGFVSVSEVTLTKPADDTDSR